MTFAKAGHPAFLFVVGAVGMATFPEFHNLKRIPQEKSYVFVRQWLNSIWNRHYLGGRKLIGVHEDREGRRRRRKSQ